VPLIFTRINEWFCFLAKLFPGILSMRQLEIADAVRKLLENIVEKGKV